MAKPASKTAPPARARTPIDAFFQALPDCLATLSCAVALAQPDWPGYDLLRTSGLLFFVELPLAMVALFAGVLRIEDRAMDRGSKLGFLLLPPLCVAAFAFLLLGPSGLLAVAWLSAGNLYRLFSGAPPRTASVPGFWITYTQGDGDAGITPVSVSVGGRGKSRSWKVQGGAEQFDAVLTVMLWMVIAALMFFVHLPHGGVTDAYAEQVGWTLTPIGQMVPPHKALWAGLILFALRTISKVDHAQPEPPPPKIEDDPVLAEIVRKIDSKGRGNKPRKKR